MGSGPSMSPFNNKPFGKQVRKTSSQEALTDNPKCACGGMFPLDRSKTGERICAACYKKEQSR